ncbi:hypothetical protein EXM65_17855 [Clostridium botulinum]|uniref:Replication initiation protein n=3 Tax=Clostridium TaxID=1485 RepID=A0A6M0SSX9_CLOBO|nr:hypothetical protein [Clostridium botulinum]MCS6133267.1 hypothetical protein [Clostridium botulinum]NFA44360.1 hypothetical protein [Clostridium botulinum]NFA44371.1 hypothetical protein [Clostridium botulinum]NFL91176.1 hypothetical protein [Clostridium botulinum]
MINDKDLNSITYCSRIDTLETREPVSNRRDITICDIKGIHKNYIINDFVKTVYNPNNFNFGYNTEYKLSKTISTLDQMQTVMTVLELDNVEYKRVDIATDISVEFKDISKFLDLIHKCIRAKEKGGKAWDNTCEDTLNISNYRFINRSLGIEFYDKLKESAGKALYPTRMEIRFLRISSKDFKFHVNNSINLWKAMSNNLDQVENEIVEILKNKWTEEKELSIGLTFTEFVYKWSDKIFTTTILKELYKFSGLKGSYKSWLQRYRSNHHIEFYSKNNLRIFSKNIIESLKDYLKND